MLGCGTIGRHIYYRRHTCKIRASLFPALVLNVALQFTFIVKPLQFGFIEVWHHKEFCVDHFSNEIAV